MWVQGTFLTGVNIRRIISQPAGVTSRRCGLSLKFFDNLLTNSDTTFRLHFTHNYLCSCIVVRHNRITNQVIGSRYFYTSLQFILLSKRKAGGTKYIRMMQKFYIVIIINKYLYVGTKITIRPARGPRRHARDAHTPILRPHGRPRRRTYLFCYRLSVSNAIKR